MRTSKRSILLLLLVVSALGGTASAVILPASSHYEGSQFFSQATSDGFISGTIDFAVYDTDAYPNEFVGLGGYDVPGDGQYVYAYQINVSSSSTDDIGYFGVLNLIGGETPDNIEGTDAYDDYAGGVEPGDIPAEGVWIFDGGMLIADGQSYFLVFSSDYDWTEGTYEMESSDDDFPVPGVPEPATVALLGVGAIAAAFKRKKCIRRRRTA